MIPGSNGAEYYLMMTRHDNPLSADSQEREGRYFRADVQYRHIAEGSSVIVRSKSSLSYIVVVRPCHVEQR